MSSRWTLTSSPPLGRSGQRSRNGCWTCRTKKVKCDEIRPICRRCVRLKLLCDYAPRVRGVPKDSTAGTFIHYSNVFSYLDQTPSPHVTPEAAETPCIISTSIKSPPRWGGSGLEVGNNELEAIRFFRDSFSPLIISKNPKYSAFSILLQLAAHDSLLLHMVLAIGGCGIDYKKQWSQTRFGSSDPQIEDAPSEYRLLGLKHYSTTLRELRNIVNGGVDVKKTDLDSLTSVLLLIIMHEQLHGDPECAGLANHLNGVSLILKHHYNDVLRQAGSCHQPSPLMRTAGSGSNRHLSQYCARLLIRIIGVDTSASSFGIGGQITKTLCGAISDTDNTSSFPIGPIESLSRLDSYSGPLYRTMWGEDYPAREIVDDLQNRQVFDLLGACSQLRYLISEMRTLLRGNSEAASHAAKGLETSIHETGRRYANLIDSASRLTTATDSLETLVANLRWVVPVYYTEVLEFLHVSRGMQPPLGQRLDRGKTIGNVMTLAFQAYQHGGDTALLKIARPLFIVALETDNQSYLAWIAERFRGLTQFGKPLARASDFMKNIVQAQGQFTTRVDLRTRFLDQATRICLCLT